MRLNESLHFLRYLKMQDATTISLRSSFCCKRFNIETKVFLKNICKYITQFYEQLLCSLAITILLLLNCRFIELPIIHTTCSLYLSEHRQISNIKLFAKIGDGLAVNCFRKKLHLRGLTGLCIRVWLLLFMLLDSSLFIAAVSRCFFQMSIQNL